MRPSRLHGDHSSDQFGDRGFIRACASRRWIAVACLLIAMALPLGARVLAGPRGAVVHVRWQTGVELESRRQLETRFKLAGGELLDGTTWRYVLIDPSRSNVRALVSEPAVEDTHHIDRRNGTIAGSTTRTPRLRRLVVNGDADVLAADIIAIALAAFASFLIVVARYGRVPLPRPAMDRLDNAVTPLLKWLLRGIPETTATTAGVFRIAFGICLLWFFSSHPENASALDATFNPLIEGELHAAVFGWLRAHAYVADALMPWLLITGVAFTAGVFTRFSYALFVAGAVLWLFVATTHDSTHPHSTLGLTLVALLPSRWGDRLSIDSWRRREDSASGKRYGYSMWVPGLVCGIAFAAAAWAKLTRGDIGDWILNGSVKYHFITDAHNAPVDWGLQLAGHPWLAVAASFGAVAVELLVISAAFSRSERYRMLMGGAAVGLLGGFFLFMGVFWPGWWILLLAFLPWQRISQVFGTAAGPAAFVPAHRATGPQIAMVVALLGQQVAFSTLRIERSPMFTYYPMYSSTYASSDEFNAAMMPYYRIVVSTDSGSVELSCGAPENLIEEFRIALQGSNDAAARVWRAVRGCAPNIGAARQVTLEGDQHVFDWERLAFKSTRGAIVLGPLAVNATVPPAARD